jgi:hypothetical protein
MVFAIGFTDRRNNMQGLLSSNVMMKDAQMPTNAYKSDPVVQEYEEKAKNLLKAELKRRGLSYRELAEKLAAIGVSETERNLNNKISRGGFSAAFFIQCLSAIGCRTLGLESE